MTNNQSNSCTWGDLVLSSEGETAFQSKNNQLSDTKRSVGDILGMKRDWLFFIEHVSFFAHLRKKKHLHSKYTTASAQENWQNTLYKEARRRLFVWDLFLPQRDFKVSDTSHLQYLLLYRNQSCFLQVSGFAFLCVLQVFISVCVSARWSPETLSELTLSLVEPLSSKDAPLRR